MLLVPAIQEDFERLRAKQGQSKWQNLTHGSNDTTLIQTAAKGTSYGLLIKSVLKIQSLIIPFVLSEIFFQNSENRNQDFTPGATFQAKIDHGWLASVMDEIYDQKRRGEEEKLQ